MREGLSHRIVHFIAGLLPIYTFEHVGDLYCARSLVDGTLILPMDEPEENESGFVMVHWQGDAARSTEVLGSFLAGVAVARYLEVHALSQSPATKNHFGHLAQHFEFKTGASLGLNVPDTERTLIEVLSSATKALGKESVRAIVSAKLGGMV